MIVDIVNLSKNELPKYETLLSAGMDIRANLEEPITIKPNQRLLIKTDLINQIFCNIFSPYFGVL